MGTGCGARPEGGPSATFKFTLTQRSRPEGVGRTVAVTRLPTSEKADAIFV